MRVRKKKVLTGIGYRKLLYYMKKVTFFSGNAWPSSNDCKKTNAGGKRKRRR